MILADQVPYFATQSGFAVGRFEYPFPNDPIWPDLISNFPKITKDSGVRKGASLREFKVAWEYSFTSAFPLVADPNQWPI
jgi:hypothetical protein